MESETELLSLLQRKFGDRSYTSLNKSLAEIESHLSEIVFPSNILNEDERSRLSAPLSWLFCTLLETSVNDNNGSVSEKNISLQKEIVICAYNRQRWWYTKLLEAYTSVLKQILQFSHVNNRIELSIPIIPQDEYIDLPPIVISNEKQVENLMNCCVSVLTHTTLEFCNMKREKGIEIRSVMLEILQSKSIHMKTNTLIFFRRYLKALVLIDDKDTLFFLLIVQSLSRIFKNIPVWYHESSNKEIFKAFHENVRSFLESVPIADFNFHNQANLQTLVVNSCEVIYLQSSDEKSDYHDYRSVMAVTEMLKKALNNFEYTLYAVSSLSMLSSFSQPNISSLMKFLIIAEMESSTNFQVQVVKTSKTWQKIHESLSLSLLSLPNLTGDNFNAELRKIAEVVQLAYQVEFEFTKRHQFSHGKHPKTCICNSLVIDAPVSRLMKFGDWDYQHISLEMFEEISGMTQKILGVLEKCQNLMTEAVVIFIDIFATILMFSNSYRLVETVKQVLLAVVASPFYKSLNDSPQFRSLAGFQKVMTFLPKRLQSFFDAGVVELYLNQMKIDSIVMLSHLEISAINAPCWWLTENIMQLVMLQNIEKLKETFIDFLPNFIVNNGDKFSSIVDRYQKIVDEFNLQAKTIRQLKSILCLSSGSVVILKINSEEHHFRHFVVCDTCKLTSMILPKDKKTDEIQRRLALMKSVKGLLVSPDAIRLGKKNVSLDVVNILSQPDDFKLEIYTKIPSLLNHSKDLQDFIQGDKGKSFFGSIFSSNFDLLEKLDANFNDILRNIRNMNFSQGDKDAILTNCFSAFAKILEKFAFCDEANEQHLMVSLAATFVSNVPTEQNQVKCFKVFMLYIIQHSSKIQGEASNAALEMARQNNITLEQLIMWHRTFLIDHIVHMCITNFLIYKTSLLNSLTNFIRRINIPRMRDFLPQNLATIVAIALPKAVQSKKLMATLEQLCQVNQYSIGEVIFYNFIKIYAEVYIEGMAVDLCKAFFEQSMKMTIHDRLQMNIKKFIEESLVYYNRSPAFVMEVLKTMLVTTDEEVVAAKIEKMLLSVLIYFEQLLASPDCERCLKKNVLLSLGDLIRLLGSTRISPICFKIINLLKAAVEQTVQDLSEYCIKVWDILIRITNVASLGPILSTIFVSLEVFIEKYPNEVNKIFKYLIEDNVNLLSRHIGDLFFISKTRVDPRIKQIVGNLLASQKLNDKGDFRSTLQSLMRHMNNENSDLKIRVYCLQYITELFQNNREKLNDMICGQMAMDPIIENLMDILISNCKTTNSKLQLATAECLGELGAIEPSLQNQNHANQKGLPKQIHSEEFTKLALEHLCRSYQYKNDSKHIDALSLAIQQLLKESGVTLENRSFHEVWLSIPEKMRPLLEPLITSSYIPKQTVPATIRPIFLNIATTPSDWAQVWAGTLIAKIPAGKTRLLLESLRPSMKNNHYTTSIFLPYMLLHCIMEIQSEEFDEVVAEIQYVFDVLMDNAEDENKIVGKKPLIIKNYDFNPCELRKKNISEENTIEAIATKIAKMIFEAFDFLEDYRRATYAEKKVDYLFSKFDLEEMAHVNYKCGEYARALIYIETKMKQPREDQQKHLPFLARIYAKLGCTDSVEGVQDMKTSEWSLEEKIMISNITGNFQDSAANCEQMMRIQAPKFDHVQSMVTSYIALDQPETALMVYENMIKKFEKLHNFGDEIKAEPLLRLSRFDELEELLERKDVVKSTSWGVQCGKMMLKLRRDDEYFFDELANTRMNLMKNMKISGSEQSAYCKNYKEIVNFHLTTEFEKVQRVLDAIKSSSKSQAVGIMKDLILALNLRMEFVEKNGAVEEPILGLHRIILKETKGRLQGIFGENQTEDLDALIDGEISNLWMQSTKLACKNKMFQQAQIYILNAESYNPKGLFLEKGKLLWSKNDQNGAFKILELGLKKVLGVKEKPEQLNQEDRNIYSKGKLMIARYQAEAVNLDFQTNLKLFKEANVDGVQNEKLFLATADFMDRYYSSKEEGGSLTELTSVMRAYLNSMVCGSEHVFQAMPRFLSIWLDTTADNSKASKHDLSAMNKLAEKAAERLQPYMFYTALSQIIARICHPSSDTFAVLKKIVVRLICEHPQQALWYLIPMLKSTNANRAAKCKEILNGDMLKGSQMQNLIRDYNSLIDKFIKLTMHEVPKPDRQMSAKKTFPDLVNFLRSNRSQIIIPFQSNLKLIRTRRLNSFKFSDDTVKIHSIQDKVDIMASLQRPRKVTLIGDDGKEYPALFKPKDDCRIDQRFMEFSSVLKEFLHKDPESRRRQLTTRTYCVIPMNENAGLIEWVPNLRPFKEIILTQYKKKGHRPPPFSQLAQMNLEKMSKENQIIEYRKLIKKFYPTFGDYFREQFPSPQNFFKARSAYIRSTAIWSIVGYIMGLGDRHGENILIDVCSGETFHVDCNLLFNKGETLAVPETIPFRLTHNMIDAMGVLGFNGPFRKSCEIILRVLQKEKRTLLAYVRPIIYDTSADASRREVGRRTNEMIELSNYQKIQRVEMRLNGIVQKFKGSSGIPLSTEGQVSFLIKEATSEENLAGMFYGWMPWM